MNIRHGNEKKKSYEKGEKRKRINIILPNIALKKT